MNLIMAFAIDVFWCSCLGATRFYKQKIDILCQIFLQVMMYAISFWILALFLSSLASSLTLVLDMGVRLVGWFADQLISLIFLVDRSIGRLVGRMFEKQIEFRQNGRVNQSCSTSPPGGNQVDGLPPAQHRPLRQYFRFFFGPAGGSRTLTGAFAIPVNIAKWLVEPQLLE